MNWFYGGVSGAEPPWWNDVMLMGADGWGPPWEIEEHCSQLWYARWQAVRQARAAAAKT